MPLSVTPAVRSVRGMEKHKQSAKQNSNNKGKNMKKLIKTTIGLAACLAAVLGLVSSGQAGPAASVTGAAVDKNPVCPANADGGVTVSATVDGTFDANPADVINEGNWGNITATTACGLPVNQSRTVTKTVTSYGAKQLVIDGVPSAYSGSVSYSKNYTVPSPDGSYSLTVTASASEVKTVTGYTRTDYRLRTTGPGGPEISNYCEGSFSVSSGPTDTTLTSSTVSGNASFRVDLTAPVALLWPDNAGANPDKTIRQSQSVHPHVRITGGSSGQTYSLTAIATAPDSTTYTAVNTGTFGNQASGVANPENTVWSLEIPCDAPLGEYTLSVTVDSNDLCGDAWPQVVLDAGTFTVTSGLNISAQTVIVTDLGTSGYGESSTFTGVQNKKTKVINTTPGSWHVTTTLTTAGPCAGFGSYSPSWATLGLDPDFVFADSGASPAAHIFIGDTGGGGFDLHDGAPLIEVTGLPISFTQDLVTLRNVSVTVDLSSLGSIPSTTTIYIRSHFKYLPVPNALPSVDTIYTFGSSTSADAGADSSSTTLTLDR
jgi:hypothetical protein